MLEKAVQAAIYEKALKNHYIEILYIDFEDTGKCIKLYQDTNLSNGENIFYRKRNPQGKWFHMQSDFSYLIVGKKKYIYVTYQDVSALQKNEVMQEKIDFFKSNSGMSSIAYIVVAFKERWIHWNHWIF